jgi:hypothetical protein
MVKSIEEKKSPQLLKNGRNRRSKGKEKKKYRGLKGRGSARTSRTTITNPHVNSPTGF